MKIKRKNLAVKFFFLFPSVAVFLVFMVWPIFQSLYLSFLEWNMVSPNKKFVGLRNYISLFSDPNFTQTVINTGLYVLFLMLTCFVFPYFLSYVIAHMVKKGKALYRSLLFFPSLISLAVAATVFSWIFNGVAGPVATIYKMLGLTSPVWFSTGGYVILALSLTTAWKAFGYNMLVFLAAVVEVPIELLEAARLEKASNWFIFWRIILPLTSPTAFYVFVITLVFGLQYVFTPIHMITQGGPNYMSTNIVYVIYQYAFIFFQSGKAGAVSILTLIVFFSLVVVYKKIEKKVHYEI